MPSAERRRPPAPLQPLDSLDASPVRGLWEATCLACTLAAVARWGATNLLALRHAFAHRGGLLSSWAALVLSNSSLQGLLAGYEQAAVVPGAAGQAPGAAAAQAPAGDALPCTAAGQGPRAACKRKCTAAAGDCAKRSRNGEDGMLEVPDSDTEQQDQAEGEEGGSSRWVNCMPACWLRTCSRDQVQTM